MTTMDLGAGLETQVTAAAGGDRAAFAVLVDATSGLVASIALAILRDVEQSHDVAQDVFFAAWRDLRKLRQPASFLPWLRQLTRNRAHEVLRTRVRRRRVLSDAEADTLLDAASDPRPGACERLLAEEEERLVASAIEQLPDEAREVVTLYYREGRSARQVAELLGLREDAVRQRLARARTRLRETLLERAGEALRRSAPGAKLTAAVMGALALAGPGVASAAGAGAAAKAGSGWLAKLAALFGGATLGGAAGLAGVWHGARRLLATAHDDQESRELRRFAVASSALVVGAAAAFPVTAELTHSRWSGVAVWAVFAPALTLFHTVWLPRVVARRLVAERERDPAAAARQARERRMGYFGLALGLACGTAGVVASFWWWRG